MRSVAFLAAGAAALFVAGQAAAATTLYNEAWNPANAGGYSDQVDFRWASPFSLSSNSTVDTVTWYGSSFTGGDLTGVGFDIDFYANDASGPGSPVPGANVAHFSGTPTFTDTGSLNRYQYEVYVFSLDVTPLALSASTPYWVSVASHGNAADTQFIWEKSSVPTVALSVNGGTTWSPNGEGTAFSLIGSVNPTGGSAPEPAAWALMIVGFGGAGAALRRRRLPAQA